MYVSYNSIALKIYIMLQVSNISLYGGGGDELRIENGIVGWWFLSWNAQFCKFGLLTVITFSRRSSFLSTVVVVISDKIYILEKYMITWVSL